MTAQAVTSYAGPLLDGPAFREAMSQLAAPITIVTVRDETGRPWGFTASSVSSASLEPPLLTVGISRTSSCHEALIAAPEFVVNVLGSRHREVATRFATHGVDRFAAGDFRPWPGSELPCLPDAHARYRCVTTDVIPVGDHDLLVGAVVEAGSGDPADLGDPLLWYQRGFHTCTAAQS
ncbi:flavin reductase ActVB [Streptomyces sp. 3211.6]|uniref:flavin reductase family protein n=1 Tax=Streptomyces sp. 3211.6 TaxID=1938845 RepID=UPI000F22CC87|nr:flavin reductase family protein [Streptomyces sp. 3211.6]RKT04563.1 flavin reductase ActVB [Streptomyces sp. 3211.6]